MNSMADASPGWAEYWPANPFADFPAGGYNLIYADPAWKHLTWSAKGTGRSAEQHYPVMPTDQIAALPVGDLAAANCVLFMWVVRAMLPEAMLVLRRYGFTFKTVGYIWVKVKGKQDRLFYYGEDVRMGMGHHSRAGAEQCWIATRGRGYSRLSKGEPEVVMDVLREHSRKPDSIRTSIERLVGDVPRIELFARQRFPGWDAWGNELGRFK